MPKEMGSKLLKDFEDQVDELIRTGAIQPRTGEQMIKRHAEKLVDSMHADGEEQMRQAYNKSNQQTEPPIADYIDPNTKGEVSSDKDNYIDYNTYKELLPEGTQSDYEKDIPEYLRRPIDPALRQSPSDEAIQAMGVTNQDYQQIQPKETDFVKPSEETQAVVQPNMYGDTFKGIEAGYNRTMKGVVDESEAAQQLASKNTELYNAQSETLKETKNKNTEELNRIDQKVADETDKLGEIRDRLINTKIDPERFINNMPTSNKIVAFIGIALGGLAGGPNQALAMFNKHIDRDIAAQEKQIDTLRMGANIQGNLLNQLNRQFGNKMAAQSAARVLMMDKFALDLKKVAAENSSPMIKAKAEQMIGKLKVEKNIQIGKFQGIMAKQIANTKRKPLFGSAGNHDPATLSKDERDCLVGGVGITANKRHALRLTQAASDIKPAVDALNQMLKISQNPANIVNLKKRAIVDTMRIYMGGKLRLPFTGPGVLQEKEFLRLMDAIGNPKSLRNVFTGEETQKIKTTLWILQNALKTEMELAGIRTNDPANTLTSWQGEDEPPVVKIGNIQKDKSWVKSLDQIDRVSIGKDFDKEKEKILSGDYSYGSKNKKLDNQTEENPLGFNF